MTTLEENEQGGWAIYTDGIKVDTFNTLPEAQAECIENNWKIDKINWNAKVTENWPLAKK